MRNHWASDIKLRDKNLKVILNVTLNSLKNISEGEKDEEARIKREFKNLEILRIRLFQKAKKARLFLNNERTSNNIFHKYYKLYLG